MDTPISTKQRIFVIVQLCFAISLLLWYAAQPFMGEYFTLRSRMLSYEFVTGTGEKNEKNLKYFTLLPLEDQITISNDYQKLVDYAKRPWWVKIKDGLVVVLFRIPPFELAWISFSLVLGILILLKKPGAQNAAWLLPLIVLCYAVNNLNTGVDKGPLPDATLFPSERELLHNYLHEDLSNTIEGQRHQLKRGWEIYLAANWSPSEHLEWSNKIEEGEYFFTLQRLRLLQTQRMNEWLHHFNDKVSYPLLALYLIWNLYFAWSMQRQELLNSERNRRATENAE